MRFFGGGVWIFGLLIAVGGATAQNALVWQYAPSQPGVMFHDQPGLTYWVPYAEPPVFDSICHLTESGSVNVNIMIRVVTPLPDSTLQPLTVLAPDGRSFTFDATISHADGPSAPGLASMSIPIDHPAAVGLTEWSQFRARLPASEPFDLPLLQQAHEAATLFLADCATLTTAPLPVPGPPDLAWRYQAGAGPAGGVLSYWYLDLSQLMFEATCVAPGQAAIRMAAQRDPVMSGQAATIRMTGPNGESMTISGSLFDFYQESGHNGFAVTLALTHPLFQWLEAGNYIGYGVEGQTELQDLDVTQAGTAVRDFMAGCAIGPGAGAVTVAPENPTGHSGCAQFGQVQSGIGSVPFQATFVNRQLAPRVLFWIDTQGQAQQIAYLDPGYQTSFVTDQAHVWLVTDGSGQCRGMIRPVPGRPVIELVE